MLCTWLKSSRKEGHERMRIHGTCGMLDLSFLSGVHQSEKIGIFGNAGEGKF